MTTPLRTFCCFLYLLFGVLSLQAQEYLDLGKNLSLYSTHIDSTLEISTPFTITSALAEAGIINNEDIDSINKISWVQKTTWTLEIDFNNPYPGKTFKNYLTIDRLATYATVYLNNKEIGHCNNALIKHSFYVNPYLKSGRNKLKIVLHPTTENYLQLSQMDKNSLADLSHVHRESQLFRMEDINRPYPYRGIIGKISLESWKNLRVVSRNLHIQFHEHTGIVEDKMHIDVFSGKQNLVWERQTFRKNLPRPLTISRDTINDTSKEIHTTTSWENINSWKPNKVNQSAYGYKSILRDGDEILWEDSTSISFLQSELSTENETGTPTFKINEFPIFIQGIDVLPLKYFPDKSSHGQLDYYFKLLQASNVNLVRLPAGSAYATPDFYNYCDSIGIMVWQDFMFYDANYPLSPDYMENIQDEIVQVLNEGSFHPSQIVWQGSSGLLERLGDDRYYSRASKRDLIQYEQNYKRLFKDKLPILMEQLAKNSIYIESPTVSFNGKKGSGEFHAFSPWYNKGDVEEVSTGFITSAGFYSYSRKEFNGSADTHLRKLKIRESIAQEYGVHFKGDAISHREIYLSQVSQYRSLHKFLKSHIMKQPSTTGVILNRLNDPAPTISSSIVDNGGFPKAGFYAVKANYAQVRPLFKEEGNRLIPHLRTVSADPITYSFQLQKWDVKENKLLATYQDSIILQDAGIHRLDSLFDEPLYKSTDIMWIISLDKVVGFRIEDLSMRTDISHAEISQLSMDKPQVQIKSYKLNNGRYALDLTTDKIAYYTQLEADIPGIFTDNVLLLLPGFKQRIYFTPFKNQHREIEFKATTLNDIPLFTD